MNRKGPWEGYRRQARRRLARCVLPAFLCAHIFRETSGYEADSTAFSGNRLQTSAILVYDFRAEYLQLATKYQLHAVDEIQGSVLKSHD